MPNLNGKGPKGKGPMSGRGKGRCGGSSRNMNSDMTIGEETPLKGLGQGGTSWGGGKGNCHGGKVRRRNSSRNSE